MAHCEDSLRKIWQAIGAFQNENAGANPDGLEDLLGSQRLSAWDLVCPTSADAVGQCSYAYRGGDLDKSAAGKMILAYDKEPLHKGRRNILFADGRVDRPKEKTFFKAIEEDNQRREESGWVTKPV